jgi:hypothetical protein
MILRTRVSEETERDPLVDEIVFLLFECLDCMNLFRSCSNRVYYEPHDIRRHSTLKFDDYDDLHLLDSYFLFRDD